MPIYTIDSNNHYFQHWLVIFGTKLLGKTPKPIPVPFDTLDNLETLPLADKYEAPSSDVVLLLNNVDFFKIEIM
jgi:hypothetical protein